MNNLTKLLNESDLSTRQIAKIIGIDHSIISMLKNGTRSFREIHITKLSAFFNVTSDYLLGRTDFGIKVFSEKDSDEVLYLTENEYRRLRNFIDVSIVVNPQAFEISVNGVKQDSSLYVPKKQVYRELKGHISDYQMQDTLSSKLSELTKQMTTEELERTIKFIEEYILKR